MRDRPEDLGDGWIVAAADSAGFSADRLWAMADAIASGAFQKIGSVLVARRGQLVFEGYFDGVDRASVRNTRSATKTITSMLIGIAIDRGMLVGVDAPILAFFPTNSRFSIPTRAKNA